MRATRTAILDCLEHSDNGKAFKAALEARGMMLANGDRRDCFVVIDQAGGHHALNKKLTGQTLAQTRDRLADLDRGQLPGVEQAQAMQRDRLAEREAGRREPPLEIERQFGASRAQTTEAAAPIFDRDAASRAADERIIDAAIKSGRASAAGSPPAARLGARGGEARAGGGTGSGPAAGLGTGCHSRTGGNRPGDG